MPLAQLLAQQDFRFEYHVPAGTWRWTTRVDTSLANPSYQIRDIVSPYGLLRDSIPIPGDVVQRMAETITEVQEAFAPAILLGPTSSLTFTYDEGRGFSPGQAATVTNNGPYGSLLGVNLVSSDPFVRVTPTSVGGLASNETGQFEVSVDTSNLLASGGPYLTTVTVQDPRAINNPQVLSVTVSVRPKAVISASPTTLQFVATHPLAGPFSPIPFQQFTIQNLGPSGSVLDYQINRVTNCSPWLVSFSPASGQLAASAMQPIQVVVQPPEGTLAGTYQETLRISGYSSNAYQDVVIQLTVF